MNALSSRYAVLLRTVLLLGPGSIVQVLLYRVLKRLRYYVRKTPAQRFHGSDDLFSAPTANPSEAGKANAPDKANVVIAGRQRLFGGEAFETGSPPNWLRNPLTGVVAKSVEKHWSRIPHFDPDFGDIKLVWELSRFSWLLLFARAYLQSGDVRFVERANAWVVDWMKHNPVNVGSNWMCGQETAIRLNHVLLADALLHRSSSSSDRLEFFVRTHCERIEATLYYAKGQKNNHIVSEAVGLFIGGSWLENYGKLATSRSKGCRWGRKGCRILEKSVNTLIMDDGSFSQYSTVYHRVLLDTLSIAEWWRRRYGLTEFSKHFYNRALAATDWLHYFVDPDSGEAPNLGGNDGALVYALCDAGHRDFRPTVQLAGYLFGNKDYYGKGEWNEPLKLLELNDSCARARPASSRLYANGGFAILRAPDAASRIFVRYPRFQFRPSQSDLMHVDLWSDGINILRDAGTFGYAAQPEDSSYFGGVQAHNTCQFDGRDQMPRLSRFLFGAWLKSEALSFDSADDRPSWSAAYTDYRGCHHSRNVSYESGGWVVVDDLGGFEENAVLRWRVCPDVEWSLSERGIESTLASLSCSSDSDFARIELCTGWESRFYLSKTALPVLEIELGPGHHRVVTKIKLKPKLS